MLIVFVALRFNGGLVHDILARSMATIKPRMDTIKAEIFKYVGIVMIKGEDGKIT